MLNRLQRVIKDTTIVQCLLEKPLHILWGILLNNIYKVFGTRVLIFPALHIYGHNRIHEGGSQVILQGLQHQHRFAIGIHPIGPGFKFPAGFHGNAQIGMPHVAFFTKVMRTY